MFGSFRLWWNLRKRSVKFRSAQHFQLRLPLLCYIHLFFTSCTPFLFVLVFLVLFHVSVFWRKDVRFVRLRLGVCGLHAWLWTQCRRLHRGGEGGLDRLSLGLRRRRR